MGRCRAGADSVEQNDSLKFRQIEVENADSKLSCCPLILLFSFHSSTSQASDTLTDGALDREAVFFLRRTRANYGASRTP